MDSWSPSDLSRSHRVDRALRVGHQARLGDLQRDRGRRDLDGGQRARDLVDERGVEQAARRDVDRDAEGPAGAPPRRARVQRLAQDGERERRDEPAVLGHRDELVRPDEAALRVHPADQRLRADHLTVEESDLGLEVDGELAVRDGVAQLGEDREPLRAARLELASVDLDPGTPGLRGVHRDVGLPEQVPGVSVRARRGDARGWLRR